CGLAASAGALRFAGRSCRCWSGPGRRYPARGAPSPGRTGPSCLPRQDQTARNRYSSGAPSSFACVVATGRAGAWTGPRPPAGRGVTLSPELAAARHEPTSRPVRAVARLLRQEGLVLLLLLGVGLALVAGGGVLEALLLRGLIDVGRDLGLREQRLGAAGGFL